MVPSCPVQNASDSDSDDDPGDFHMASRQWWAENWAEHDFNDSVHEGPGELVTRLWAVACGGHSTISFNTLLLMHSRLLQYRDFPPGLAQSERQEFAAWLLEDHPAGMDSDCFREEFVAWTRTAGFDVADLRHLVEVTGGDVGASILAHCPVCHTAFPQHFIELHTNLCMEDYLR
jgi:hypothetical protein